MLLSIESTLPSFKSVRFHEGLNVLLSDRQPEATDKQTRNSAGKTSLIEIIHFLLGAKCDKNSLFKSDELIEHEFQGEFSFGGETFVVSRGGNTPSRVFILNDLDNQEDYPVKIDKKTGRRFISNENWKNVLGAKNFGLPLDPEGTLFDQSYTPTFRSMISYFVRRQKAGGFLSPERQAEKQQRWDWQENLSYILGLDWKIPFEFQKVREREIQLEELKKTAKGGVFREVIGTVAELRSQLAVAERKATAKREQLAAFRVLESYSQLSDRAAQAKTEMQKLTRETVSLKENLQHLQSAFEKETPLDPQELQSVYDAAGVELPGVVRRRLEDVEAFYESVISNRQTHLEKEIKKIDELIKKNQARVSTLDRERSNILDTLDNRGALEDFIDLQKEQATLEAELAHLQERFQAAEMLEGESTQLDIDRSNLKRRLIQDLKERQKALDEAILLVTDTISQLYDDREGRFEVEATDRGPDFKVSIEGDKGGGIANMEIFCFDIALLKLVARKNIGPEFLIHDSHLFDGVDERQIAAALNLGMVTTKGNGLQYIVTMNSDVFDRLPLPGTVDKDEVVLSTRLSDQTETGGLFGFRFA